MTDWHAYGIKGTMPFYAQLYPCIALVTRGKLLDWWIHKHYKAFNVVCKIYKPSNTPSALQYAWKQGMHNAVINWQGFDQATKKYYNDRSKPIGDYGYHRYISLYLQGYIPTMADKVIATKLVAADGTGDFTSIQDGIDALPAAGGMVFVKEGTYTLSAKLTIAKSNVVLAGQGPATKIILANNVNDDVLNIGDAVNNITDVVVTGVSIDGNKANQTGGNGIKILAVCDRISIIDCIVKSCKWVGIRRDVEATYTRVEGCEIYDNMINAVSFSNGAYSRIVNNYIHDQGVYGQPDVPLNTETDFICSQNIIIEGGTASNNGGIYLTSCSRAIVEGNEINGVTIGIYLSTINNLVISGNLIYNSNSSAIYGGGGTQNIISGNVINDTGDLGIDIDGQKFEVVGNSVENALNYGIYCYSGKHTIKDNTVSGCGKHGIYLVNPTYCLVSGNRLYNNGQTTNDTYSDIFLAGNTGAYCSYNHISDNYIVADGANKTKYGIRENSASDNYNSIWNNRVIGPVTAAISIQGANTNASDNLIT